MERELIEAVIQREGERLSNNTAFFKLMSEQTADLDADTANQMVTAEVKKRLRHAVLMAKANTNFLIQ